MDTTLKLNTRQFLSLLIGIFIFQSCLDDPSIPDESFNSKLPEVETSSIESHSGTSITVSGAVLQENGAEVTEKGICWGTSSPVSAVNKAPAGKGLGSFTAEVKGLSANTKYYLRAYAINAKGTAYGQERTVETTSEKPSIAPLKLLQVRMYEADLESEVTSEGDATVTARGICFSESASGSINNDSVFVGTGIGKFSVTIKNLKTNTTYYARSFAVNSFGIQYSDTIQFTTQNALPTVKTSIFSDNKDGKSKVGGNVVDMGYSEITARGICWSFSNEPTIQDNVFNFTPGTGAFSGYLEKINGGKTYHIRAFATNSIGTSYGDEFIFTAPPIFADMASFTSYRPTGAAAFSSYGRAYFVGGDVGQSYSNIVWEFDPISDTWRDRNIFPLGGRKFVTAFSTDATAYLLGGLVNPGQPTTEFYKYKVSLNEWEILPPFPGTPRWSAKATVQSKGSVTYGYVIGGRTTNSILNEVWKYNINNGEWKQIENFPTSQYGGIVLSKNDTIFAGLGQTGESTSSKTLWISSGDMSTWKEETEIPNLAGTISSGVILNDCLYVIDSNNRIWEYNIKQKVWTSKSTLGGYKDEGHSMMLLNGSIYIGMSVFSSSMKKYNPIWDN
ncbi:hypothetical protein A9168_13730 [Macellibacteroides sp. HH-ZS]|nr:hypothetical protein A9168_13730 [Macellibacteroides sp. HH-ZS]